MNIVEIIN